MALELTNVKKILTLTGLNDEQQAQVLAEAKDKGIFAGQAAVNLGITTQTRMDDLLLIQSQNKVSAAAEDIGTIRIDGTQEAPADFKAHWGNRGVNKAPDMAGVSEAVSALAQMSENMVVLANTKPEIAAELSSAVSAARQLTSGIALGTPALTADQATDLSNKVVDGLRSAVTQTGVPPRDEEGNLVSLEQFIDERSKEIKAGIAVVTSRTVTAPAPVAPEAPIAAAPTAETPAPEVPPGAFTQQLDQQRQQPPAEGQNL